jgi:hypothetical protein
LLRLYNNSQLHLSTTDGSLGIVVEHWSRWDAMILVGCAIDFWQVFVF